MVDGPFQLPSQSFTEESSQHVPMHQQYTDWLLQTIGGREVTSQ